MLRTSFCTASRARERGRGVERGEAGHIPPLAAILKFLGAIAAFRGHVSARDYNGVAQRRDGEGRRVRERGLKTAKERQRERERVAAAANAKPFADLIAVNMRLALLCYCSCSSSVSSTEGSYSLLRPATLATALSSVLSSALPPALPYLLLFPPL